MLHDEGQVGWRVRGRMMSGELVFMEICGEEAIDRGGLV
jgi:hypothetical protein